jgi:hypothetical protein
VGCGVLCDIDARIIGQRRIMDRYLVPPDTQTDLAEWKPSETGDISRSKKEARRILKPLN